MRLAVSNRVSLVPTRGDIMKRNISARLATTGVAAVLSASVLAGRSSESAANWKAPRREADKKNPVPADGQSVARGKEIYAKNCADCHGAAGKGDGPKGADLEPKPRDLSSSQVQAEGEGALYWKITTGRRPMPSFAKLLSEKDRWHTVNYIRTLGPATRPANN